MRTLTKWLLIAALFTGISAPVAAQCTSTVTGTFKTPDNQTPSGAGLDAGDTIAGTSTYGRLEFVPYDSSGRRATRILCAGVTFPPQPVVAWIKGDGTILNSAGGNNVTLIATAGSTPTGLVYRLTVTFNPSTANFRNSVTYSEEKAMPTGAQDWGNLAVAGITALTYTGYNSIMDEGTSLTARTTLNFIGAGVSCVDNNSRTECTITGGGGGGSVTVREVDGAPSVASVTILEFLQSDGFIVTDQTGGVARVALTLADANIPDTITLTNITQITNRALTSLTASGLTTGHVVRATGATTFAWQQLNLSDLAGAATAAQLPSGTGYLEGTGSTPSYVTDLGQVRSLRASHYWIAAYANLQAAIDAANTAGGGLLACAPNTQSAVPSTGLVMKNGVGIRGPNPPTVATNGCSITTAAAAGGVHAIELATSGSSALENTHVLAAHSASGATVRINGASGPRFSISGSSLEPTPVNYTKLGFIFLGTTDNGSQCSNFSVRSGFATGAQFLNGVAAGTFTCTNFHVGTHNVNIDVDAFNDLQLGHFFMDEQNTVGLRGKTNSLRVKIADANLFGGSGTTLAVDLQAGSDQWMFSNVTARPYGANNPTNLVQIASNENFFVNFMALNSSSGGGTATTNLRISGSRNIVTNASAPVVVVSGNNNLLWGIIAPTFTDSGTGNIFVRWNGSAWVGNLPDALLATISTTDKVSPGAINDGGVAATQALFSGAGAAAAFRAIAAGDLGSGFVDAVGDLAAGLCVDTEILKKSGGAWTCAADATGGSPTLNSIAAAAAGATINNGDNAIVWNWSLTTAGKSAFTFGENVASTATTNPVLVNINTLAASTLHPLQVTSRGTVNGIRVGATDGVLIALGTGGVDFAALLNYPAGCTNQFVRSVGDTLTCATVVSTDVDSSIVKSADTVTRDFPLNCTHPRVKSLAGNAFYDIEGLTTGDFDMGVFKFLDAVDGRINCTASVPNELGASPAAQVIFDVQPHVACGASQNFRVNIRSRAWGSGSADTALTAETAQDASGSTTAHSLTRVTFTLTNQPAAGDNFQLEIQRDGGHANDNCAQTMEILQQSAKLRVVVKVKN